MQNLRNLPPLNGLRAFVATARLGSITLAADHLSVTAAAVSHQIKSLEQSLKIKLFTRHNNRISLTKTGKVYLEEISPAFDSIAIATSKLHIKTDSIKILVSTSLATRWLIPKLNGIHAILPDVKINLSTTSSSSPNHPSDADITIGYQREKPANIEDILIEDKSVPVSTNPIRIKDISQRPLISATRDNWEWEIWAKKNKIPFNNLNFIGHFDTDESAILACAAGLGISLMPKILIHNEVSTGIFHELEQPGHIYGYFTLRFTGSSHPNVRRFASWLRKEVQKIKNNP